MKRADNTIQQKNCPPADKRKQNVQHYPVDGNLSSEWHYLTFQRPEPKVQQHGWGQKGVLFDSVI